MPAHHATLPAADLSWPDWLAQVEALPQLGEDELFAWARRLRLDEALLAPHRRFTPDTYHRSVMHHSARFEVVLLCWEPGQGTIVHDHAQSFGVVRILEGVLATTHHVVVQGSAASGQAKLKAVAEAWGPPGTLALERVGTIHDLRNPAEGGERCVSLHLYAGPLDLMHRYDLETGAVTQRWTRPGVQGEAPEGP